MRFARRDIPFYDQSGGGVTLSGGEPLLQSDFSLALLESLRNEMIHTAVDTCGHAPSDVIRRAAELTDLFLYDIKLMDCERHRLFTGVGNTLILENAKLLSRLGSSLWIRVPLIPGVNSSEEDLRSLSRFVAGLQSAERIQLLPYQQAAEGKARRMGLDYELKGVRSPTASQIESCRQWMQEEVSIPVSVGG